MSFSSEVKEELNCMQTLSNKELVKSELQGYLISNNVKIAKKVKFSTESEYNINRFAKLLGNCKIQDYEIQKQGKNYVIEFSLSLLKDIVEITDDGIRIKIQMQEKIEDKRTKIKLQIENEVEPIENEVRLIENEVEPIENEVEPIENEVRPIENTKVINKENAKAIIRGAFLGSGSINNPENSNHLEVQLSNKENCMLIEELLKQFDISTKNISEKVIYIKDGEEISKFLACIGANKSVLKFEEIRVRHEMSNKINRIVNCEGANLNKIMNASIEQIEAINRLKKSKKFEKLDDNLKEIANLRLENPNANLTELGKMLKSPIGKSGVNYRLKKIIELSK